MAGVVDGVSTTPAASLEGVTPSLTLLLGHECHGHGLGGAPTTVGTYTVLASFAGSTDYTSGSGEHDVHDQPSRSDRERDRRQRHLQQRRPSRPRTRWPAWGASLSRRPAWKG